MVMLGLKDQEDLIKWEEVLKSNNLKFSTFIEPDIGDQKTSIAIQPLDNSLLFKELKLL